MHSRLFFRYFSIKMFTGSIYFYFHASFSTLIFSCISEIAISAKLTNFSITFFTINHSILLVTYAKQKFPTSILHSWKIFHHPYMINVRFHEVRICWISSRQHVFRTLWLLNGIESRKFCTSMDVISVIT